MKPTTRSPPLVREGLGAGPLRPTLRLTPLTQTLSPQGGEVPAPNEERRGGALASPQAPGAPASSIIAGLSPKLTTAYSVPAASPACRQNAPKNAPVSAVFSAIRRPSPHPNTTTRGAGGGVAPSL